MKPLKPLAAAALAASLLGFAYARFLEPRWIRTRKTEIPITVPGAEKAGKKLRIVHLTDLHLSGVVSLEYLRKAFLEAAAQKPGLICLTGDYITSLIDHEEGYVEALKILSAAAPTFACPGNHDGGLWAGERGGYPDVERIRALFEKAGVTFLENRTAKAEIGGMRILVAGLGDMWAGRCAPEEIRADLDTSFAAMRILLTHNPDSKAKVKNLKWDLLLAGHTHGGQLMLPWIGTPFAPILDKKFVNGLYEYMGRKIHVSPGVGNVGGMRINCRPEISVLDLRF